MKLKKIRIQNFKCLENTAFNIKPLTFLFGPNSSGKSSFIKALRFLEMNFSSSSYSGLNYEKDNLSLGNYKEIVYNHDTNRKIIYEIELDSERENKNIENDILVKFEYEFNKDEDIDLLSSVEINDLLTNSYLDDKGVFYNHNNDTENEYLNKIFYRPPFGCKYFHKYKNFSVDFESENVIPDDWLKFENSNYNKNIPNDIEFFNDKESQDCHNEIEILGDEWYKLSNEIQNDIYKRTIEIYKLFHFEIPHEIKNLLSTNHLPTTRNQIKPVYELSGDNFKENDDKNYYNFLNRLYREQKYLYGYTNLEPKEKEDLLKAIEKKMNDIDLLKMFYERNWDEASIINLLTNLGKFLITNNIFNFEELKEEVNKKRFIDNSDEFEEIKDFIDNANKKNVGKLINLILESKCCEYLLDDDPMTMPYYINDVFANPFILTNYWINILGFNFKIIFDKKDNYMRISIIKGNNDIRLNASNESSGFVQILPIIIGFAINHKNIYIEQPELHLHPKLQSQLANIFSDVFLIEKGQDERFNNNIYIFVETHSEHLIRKIQVLIAKGEIKKENIAVNYLGNENGKINVKEMFIEEDGFFKEPWPDGFFDTSYNLSKELLFSHKSEWNKN